MLMNMQLYFKRSLFVTGFASLIGISSLWKISFMVGSQMGWFSATNCVAPLAGLWTGALGSGAAFALRMIWLMLFHGFHISLLFNGLPYLCASTYFIPSSYVIRLGLPALCMGLFWVHPIGFQAAAYPLFWII